MKTEMTLKICGAAGQGMQTIGAVLCKAFQRAGYYVLANQDYMSRVRGGNNFAQIRIGTAPVNAVRERSDIIVALDKPSLAIHSPSLAQDGIMVLDSKKLGIQECAPAYFPAPLFALAAEAGGELYVNSVACGLLANLLSLDMQFVEQVLRETFARKEETVVQNNLAAARKGFDFGAKKSASLKFGLAGPATHAPTLLLNTSEAIGLAAIKAGVKFYSAYPMSPSTDIMNFVARHARQYRIVVEQAEDEIAAVNMVIGAAFAGVRAMTSTSGGGFALMTEGLSLAAMTETPVVLVDAQRPAPATGFPTRTEQADLHFLIHAGHGEFARVIFSPGNSEQAYTLTQKAFNLAEKYQIPVMIMIDQYLVDTARTLESDSLQDVPIERHLLARGQAAAGYQRYALTPSGVSPRAIPSWSDAVIYADSDEHDETGHITEDARIRIKMVDKRFGLKMRALAQETEPPSVYRLENAETILLGFGSTFGVLREAADMLPKTGCIHFSQVWPFPSEALQRLLVAGQRLLTVENNAGAQLARLIRSEIGLKVHGSILKYDGRPFTLEEVTTQAGEAIHAAK